MFTGEGGLWYNFNTPRTSKEKKHGVHQRRFPADHEGGEGSLPRLCGADADHRLPLPPAAGGDRGGQALGEHRAGVAGRRPLQVAPDALERRRREVRDGQCLVGGEVQRLRRHDGASPQEPSLRLVPPRARALFRRDGASVVRDGGEDLDGDFDEFVIEALKDGFSKLDIMAFGLCVEELSISTLKNRFKMLHIDNYNEAVEIEVKHSGILEVPEGKNVDDLPIKHFVDLANKKGLSKITKALNNLQVWNKNKDPKLSKWAGDMIDKVTKRVENQKESLVKEKFSRSEINSIISQMEELGFNYDGTDIKGWLLFTSWDDNSTQAFPDWFDVQDYIINGNTSFEF